MSNRLEVSKQLHERTSPGQQVCVHLFPGALGIRWMAVGEFPDTAG